MPTCGATSSAHWPAQRRCIALDLPLHGQSPVTAGQDLSVAALAAGARGLLRRARARPASIWSPTTPAGPSPRSSPPGTRSGWPRSPSPTATPATTCRPRPSSRRSSSRRTATSRRPQSRLFGDLNAAGQVAFGSAYEHLDQVDREIIRAYLEPCFGTMERARQFERLLTALDAARPAGGRSRSSGAHCAHAWWCGAPVTTFFDVSWAYWLRDTIPGMTRVVTVDGARLFFPEERPDGSRAAPGAALGRGRGRPGVISTSFLPRPYGGAGDYHDGGLPACGHQAGRASAFPMAHNGVCWYPP